MFAERRYAWKVGRCTARAASRAVAALTALAFVLGTLVGLMHEATTRHVQCAEHGEQIHSDASPVSVRDVGELPELRRPSGAVIHGHEHCVIASATRQSRIVPSAPVIAPVQLATAAATVDAPCSASTYAARVYRTAPKTSPPA